MQRHVLQLNQYPENRFNQRFDHARPRKRHCSIPRSLPMWIILVVVVGYLPIMFFLMKDDKDTDRNARQDGSVFPQDVEAGLVSEVPDSPDNQKQKHQAQSNDNLNPKFQDEHLNSKTPVYNKINQDDKHEKVPPFEDGNFKIRTLPRNEADFVEENEKHADIQNRHLKGASELGAKLRRERDEIQAQRMAKTAAAAPKRIVPTHNPERFQNAMKNYKLYGQMDKKTTRKAVTQQMRHEHLKALPQQGEVLVAKVIHDVLGNYEVQEPFVKGPGEGGQAVRTSDFTAGDIEASMKEYGFNMAASDSISLNRTVKDTRPIQCKSWQYPDKLPSASVVIVFHNEGWSTLLRTVHSVIRTAPKQHLHEIVMVDDSSTKGHLKVKLDAYVTATVALQGKVKVFHSAERLGLIRARVFGAERATGEVVVFLDAHCECNRNWLPPLLTRIAVDRTIIAVPVVDGVDARTFEYRAIYKQPYRGIWEWGFFYKEYMVPRDQVNTWQYYTSPYKSPTHAGGLFAINKQYFFDMGGYDPGLEIWGGENFELSFKVWLCGGSVEWVPCSRIGHIYRASMPYDMGDKIGPVTQINYLRVLETWMDEQHKEYFYIREPTLRGVQYGDISNQIAFKEKHNCKSFTWFMQNHANDVLTFYPPPPENLRWGEIKEVDGDLCWDTKDSMMYMGYIQLEICSPGAQTQIFRLNVAGQLAYGEYCVNMHYSRLSFDLCKRGTVDGPWHYDTDTGLIEHKTSELCMKSDREKKRITTAACNSEDRHQQWDIRRVYPFINLMSDEFLRKEGITR